MAALVNLMAEAAVATCPSCDLLPRVQARLHERLLASAGQSPALVNPT